jgi:LacI family transcriptional regulator
MQTQDGRRPTIRDVARAASVSVATVSAVVNSSAPASPATRYRVLAAIEALGFEPDSNARNLKLRRSHAIGLLVPDVLNPFFANVAEGVEEEARAEDFVLVLCSSDFQAEREAYYTRLLRRRRLDGVIYLSGTGLPPTALAELATVEPVVFVDERVPGLDLPFVGSDNRRGARLAAEFVLDAGHRRLGIVGGPRGLWTAEQRLAGYREALASAGIEPDSVPVVVGDYRLESGRAAAKELLSGDKRTRPTALLVANDLMAVGCLQHCLAVDLSVPADVGIVGYDDVPLAALVTPSLTTVRQPAREMGRMACRLLLERIAGRAVTSEIDLAAELVVRESVGPPR